MIAAEDGEHVKIATLFEFALICSPILHPRSVSGEFR